MNPSLSVPEAKTTYIESRKTDVRESTLQSHHYRLKHLVRWSEEVANIDTVGELERADIDEYAKWRRDDGDLSKSSMKGQMDTLRVFLKYLERIGAVEDDLYEAVPSVSMSPSDRTNDRIVESEEAREILDTLDRYHYASVKHVWFLLAWRTCARISSLRALDVEDYDPEEQFIYFRERDETHLKNGGSGERPVALSDETCTILDDYLEQNRVEVEDDQGRNPLISSAQGRVHRNTMRRWCYTLTCPSFYSDNDCECQRNSKNASECEDSVSPHAIRRGSITHFLQNDLPEKVVSDRADVSEEVLDQHYDSRSQMDKMEQRRDYLNNV
ncbi:tyrosine-type recombinase/integrase [Halobacterium noricense]|uniref:tyrosine-type recombinase/integrase n=1 Tax=Halobacterium noricense TaxID=223182 RepID=UPI001E289153|nr:site-specific integrase [Halobacterium noricense]UHH25588.1 tyrosine-type recombinase/integrase [Halobacterium noricense]